MPAFSHSLKDLHDSVVPIAEEVGKFLFDSVGTIHESDIQTKGLHDYVTYVDRQAEKLIVEKLRPLVKGAGFLAEEETREEGTADVLWVIDPLDGTTNFIHKLPVYAVSIAMLESGQVVLGIVYEANNRECFSTWKGGPALLNGSEISVSRTSKLDEALIATGFPYANHSRLEGYLSMLGYLMKEARGIRRLGSAAVDLAYVACGRFDAFFEYGLKPWDVAAGSLLVQNAGGIVSNFDGKGDGIFSQEIVASNSSLFPSFILQTKTLLSKK